MTIQRLAAGLLLGTAAAFGVAALANADPDNPVIDSSCNHAHENVVAPDMAGQQLRCVAIPFGYVWELDRGPQQDPRFLDPQLDQKSRDQAFAYCTQNSPQPWECREIVYGGNDPGYR